MKIERKSPEEIFTLLAIKEYTLYEISVKTTENNVEHKSFLFTGFKSGGYCVIYNNSYEQPIDMMKVYSIKILKKLSKIENF